MKNDVIGESERRLIQQEMFQLEDQKLALEEQYQYLFENALSGLFRIDVDTNRVLTANKELLNTFKVEQLVELNYLLKRYGIFDELEELKKESLGEDTMTFSSPLQLGSEERMIQFSARYHRGHHVIEGAAKDITSLVMAEKRMLEAVKEAEQANHSKSLFLANMSHEIRTPLNGIVGFAELIEKEGGLKLSAYAGKILDESTRLMTLINHLLNISKIEANQIVLESESFLVRDLVRKEFGFFLPHLNEKNLTWEIRIDDDVADVYLGDAFRIGQIITNLLSNALKFTSRGKITLAVDLVSTYSTHDDLLFTVSDTGIGISEENHAAVFEKFIQADSSIERRFGGTGLGVAICKELVELMKGSISLVSKPGAGSSFSFQLPLQKGKRDQDKVKLIYTEKVKMDHLPSSKVLLVEDYKVNQDILILQLKDFPFIIDVAENGNEAVNLFMRNNYDIILMDVHMPMMSGLEATAKIRKMERGQDIPIIGMSASAFDTDRNECRRVGMNDFLSKPIHRKKLCSHISFWLKENTADKEEMPQFWNENPTGIEGKRELSVLRYKQFCREIESREDSNLIIEGYIESAEILLEEILQDMTSENWTRAHRNCHSLKGGALNIMGDELSEQAQLLESALKEPTGHDIMPLYHNLSQSLLRLKREFNRLREE